MRILLVERNHWLIYSMGFKKTLAKVVLAGALACGLISSNKAYATLEQRMNVTGVAGTVHPLGDFDLDASIYSGSIMNGFCTYDAEAPQDFVNYSLYPIKSASINLGNYTFTHVPTPSDPHLGFRVGHDGGYIYSISSSANVDGNIIIDGVLQPFDNDIGSCSLVPFMKLGSFSNEPDPGPPYKLPNPFPDLSTFDTYNRFRIFIRYGPSNYFEIHGMITSLEVVPEPSAILLLGLGAIALRKRRK